MRGCGAQTSEAAKVEGTTQCLTARDDKADRSHVTAQITSLTLSLAALPPQASKKLESFVL
jgi:hypothetical protein